MQVPSTARTTVLSNGPRRRRASDKTLHVLPDPAKCRRFRCRAPAVYEVRYRVVVNQSGIVGERRDPVCDVHANGRIDHPPSFVLELAQVVAGRALTGLTDLVRAEVWRALETITSPTNGGAR
jgi:hypothetical protein